jgi:hypothetical protein
MIGRTLATIVRHWGSDAAISECGASLNAEFHSPALLGVQEFLTSDMGANGQVCAAEILNRTCRLGVKSTHYRAPALLSASPQ